MSKAGGAGVGQAQLESVEERRARGAAEKTAQRVARDLRNPKTTCGADHVTIANQIQRLPEYASPTVRRRAMAGLQARSDVHAPAIVHGYEAYLNAAHLARRDPDVLERAGAGGTTSANEAGERIDRFALQKRQADVKEFISHLPAARKRGVTPRQTTVQDLKIIEGEIRRRIPAGTNGPQAFTQAHADALDTLASAVRLGTL